jgi:hypothetical protein
MDINKKDYQIIDSKFGKIIDIKFIVYKIKQTDNFTLYEGFSTEKKKERFYSIKHNENGYNGLWFKFKLTNGKEEYVKGPWYDFSMHW